MKKPTIVFMGTPDFAVPSLQALINQGFPISLVVTQPDRPSGRGQRLTPPPVKVLAESAGIEVLQTHSLRKDAGARDKLFSVPCDFLVVVAFGQILPKEVLGFPKIAPLNVHASLLPAYRGAAPIARSLMEGESETGVSIQWMVEALDMGDILHQKKCAIESDDTSEILHDRLKEIGAAALVECLSKFESNTIERLRQDPRIGSYAEKLQKSESRLSFQAPAEVVHKRIMGLNPWPVAECQVAGQRVRIFKSRFVPRQPGLDAGVIVDVTDDEIIVSCENACVGLLELQIENRKKMKTADFLRGQPLPRGLVLGDSKS
jgi:methionyl-tRNA formyltransferase